MFRFSKHTVFSKIKDSDRYFIINLLTGNADILSSEEGQAVEDFIARGIDVKKDIYDNLFINQYLMEEKEEEKLFRKRYLDFIDLRDKDEIQIFFVPGYTCNFSCSYCYQDGYQINNLAEDFDKELVIHSFFNTVKKQFAGRNKYITLFGGEPLLPSAKRKEMIGAFLQLAKNSSIEVAIVTNGYTLVDYLPILMQGNIREIQVTLDGMAEMHNKRRRLKNGIGTFEQIVRGIDACLANQLPINLRVVVDKENIEQLPLLAAFTIEKEWTKHSLFKTQIGRNYELHFCHNSSDILFTRISLYEKIFNLIKQHPHILEFHKPAFSVSKFLKENGSLPEPLFDSCPACKTEWAFDYTGKIYPCTATVGKDGEQIGTFHPEFKINQQLVGEWENRDVTSIPECKDCSLQLACGGGCGSVAKNKSGKIHSPDCRPVKELNELGFALYEMDKDI